MDEYKTSCNSCVFHSHIPSRKKLETPFKIHKQAHKLNKRGKENEERNEEKNWFKIFFDPIVWISSKQQNFIVTTFAPKVAS